MRLASERREAKRQRMDEAEGAAVTDADAELMHDNGGSAIAGASAHDDGVSAVAGATAPVSPLPDDASLLYAEQRSNCMCRASAYWPLGGYLA